jgi:N-acylneuraminate cytidylyltransferase
MKYKIIYIILARGGSKGIPKKNLKKIGDYSLVKKSLLTASSSKLFDEIILSSNDEEILLEADGINVTKHTRSEINSSDNSTSEDAVFEILNKLKIFDGICFLAQCTTPFISSDDLIKIAHMSINNSDCTIVSGYMENPHHWLYERNINKIIPIANSNLIRKARQEMKQKIFVENGGVYAFSIKQFHKTKNRFSENIIPYIMTKRDSIDIDTHDDLFIARAHYETLKKN